METTKKKVRKVAGYGLSTATRALMIGVAVIIVCIVCSLALYMSKQGKEAINSGTSQYGKMLENYQDLDKSMYDGLEVSGQEVVALIKRIVAENTKVAVRVKTKALGKYACYNYFYNLDKAAEETTPSVTPSSTPSKDTRLNDIEEIMKDKESAKYINPTATFLGTVQKDSNGMLVCIDFDQK